MFYIIPYYFISLLIIGKSRLFKKIAVGIVYTIYLIFANKFKAFFKEEAQTIGANIDDTSNSLYFYFIPDEMMEYLGIVGIIVSAILSGYGSSQVILNYLVYPFFKSKLI
jgi:hypothetical protein